MRLKPQHEIRILTLGVIVVASMMVAVIAFGVTRQAAISQELNLVVHEYNVHGRLANEMYRLARERTLLLQKIIVEEDLFVQDEDVQHYVELGSRFMESRSRILALEEVSPREQTLLTGLLESTSRTATVQQEVIDLALLGRRDEAHKLLVKAAVPLQEQVIDQLMGLVQYANAQTEKTVAQAQDIERTGEILLLGTGGTVVVMTLLIGFYVRHRVRNLTVNLEALVSTRTHEIAEGAAMMERITHDALDAIVMIDDGDTVIHWNPAAEKVFGYSQQEALGKSLHGLIMPERFRDEYTPAFANYVRTGTGALIGVTREVEARHRDGHEFPLELSLSAVKVKGRWVGIGIGRDVSERKELEQLLRQQAFTDPLTGLANRRSFDSRMAAEVSRAERYHSPLSLMFLDIDHFKAINDSHGHMVGDQVLAEMARLVSGSVRGSDSLARWGGEEFVLLSPGTRMDEMARLAEKLRVLISRHTFPVVDQAVTCSFGVAELKEGETVADIIRRADEALYEAKAAGRNCVRSKPEYT